MDRNLGNGFRQSIQSRLLNFWRESTKSKRCRTRSFFPLPKLEVAKASLQLAFSISLYAIAWY